MVGELIMLPVRVGVRATRLWFRAVEETISVGASASGRVVAILASRSPNGAGPDTATVDTTAHDTASRDSETATREQNQAAQDRSSSAAVHGGRTDVSAVEDIPLPDPQSAAAVALAESPPGAEPPAPEPADEPVHVSEEPVLVEEFAEPGAEEGAGSQVRIDPPWEGYERLNVKEVIARLGTADRAELAAVQLYEGMHRRRQTIMNAAERGLRSGSANSPRNNH